MKKMGVKITAVTTSLIVVALAIAVYIYNTKKYDIKEKFSFSEIMIGNLSFSDEEIENINHILKEKIYEDDQYYGFNDNNENINLYDTNAVVKIMDKLNNNEMLEQLKNKLYFLQDTNLGSMNILNIIYYINICDTLGLVYDRDMVYRCLEAYYDQDSRLFYLNSVNDSINIKVTVTALCCSIFEEILLYDKYEIREGVLAAYNQYEFTTGNNSSFYNSGGDILHCIDAAGMIDKIDLSKHREWYEYWNDKYESLDVDGVESALIYSEYYNIAVLFDKSYPNIKLENFYNNLNAEYLSDDIDYYMVINSIENIDIYDNDEFNSKLIGDVKDYIQQGKLYESKIDLQSTVYGIFLAKYTNFDYDKDKVQNYINKNYDMADKSRDILEITNYLYYGIMLDQIINDYQVEYNRHFLQEKVDYVLKKIEYQPDSAKENIDETRKILEIVMDLQIHNVDINITEKQRKKINKGIKKLLRSNEIRNSYLITDVCIINEILDLGLIDDIDLVQVNEELSVNGGNKIDTGDLYFADIFTTFKFKTCLELIDNYNYLEEKKEFAASLKVQEGIYSLYNSSENLYIELASILYGNAVVKQEIGGDKFDNN